MSRNKNHIKSRLDDKCFDIVNALFLTVVLIITLYPLVIVLSSSLSSPRELMAGRVWLVPRGFNLEGYRAIVGHKPIWSGVSNSVFYTVLGTAVNMVVTVLAAYPLSRKDFAPRKLLSVMFAFTMWFSGGIIPTYILVKNLGMYNSRLALIIPTAMSVWNMIIVRTYFQNSIPESLFESARLDGCDDWTYLLKIAVPISTPVLAVVSLYYCVVHWNTYFDAYIYIQKQSLQPLQIVLREILLLSQMQEVSVETSTLENNAQQLSELLKYSLVIVASVPMIVLYLFVQKHLSKGFMIGSVKG